MVMTEEATTIRTMDADGRRQKAAMTKGGGIGRLFHVSQRGRRAGIRFDYCRRTSAQRAMQGVVLCGACELQYPNE